MVALCKDAKDSEQWCEKLFWGLASSFYHHLKPFKIMANGYNLQNYVCMCDSSNDYNWKQDE